MVINVLHCMYCTSTPSQIWWSWESENFVWRTARNLVCSESKNPLVLLSLHARSMDEGSPCCLMTAKTFCTAISLKSCLQPFWSSVRFKTHYICIMQLCPKIIGYVFISSGSRPVFLLSWVSEHMTSHLWQKVIAPSDLRQNRLREHDQRSDDEHIDGLEGWFQPVRLGGILHLHDGPWFYGKTSELSTQLIGISFRLTRYSTYFIIFHCFTA